MIHEEDRSNFWHAENDKTTIDHDTAYFIRRYIEHVITKSSIQELNLSNI